jgi:hypothetical protein
LKCVSIQEHYDIHYAQEDYGAANKILSRMLLTPEEIYEKNSKLSSLMNKKLVSEGKHWWIGNRNPSHERVRKGIHNFQDPVFIETQRQRKIGSTHNQTEYQKNTVKNYQNNLLLKKNHNFQNPIIIAKRKNILNQQLKSGKHPFKKEWQCPHCDKIGQGRGNASRYHFDNCKENPFNQNYWGA